MATIVMADFDFDDCDFERKMVEAAGIQFKSFDDARNRTPPRSSSICTGPMAPSPPTGASPPRCLRRFPS